MAPRLPLSLTLAAALTLGGGLAASGALFLGVSNLEYDNMALAFAQRAAGTTSSAKPPMPRSFARLSTAACPTLSSPTCACPRRCVTTASSQPCRCGSATAR